ncbi:hypothetical protein GGQ95_000745 [Anoxybacillus rupiensis]|nr:hypothetical protein [Anoxybacillus rupiensis]
MGGFVTFASLYTAQPLLPLFAKAFHISAASASLAMSVSTGALAIIILLAASTRIALEKRE